MLSVIPRGPWVLLGCATVTAFGVHDVYISKLRKAPRKATFTPGSADDGIAEQLETGDVVLFNRNATAMLAGGALASVLTKQANNTQYDHVGVIVMKRAAPHVLEHTFSGVKLRPYEERILWSKSTEIVIRQAHFTPTREQEIALAKYIKQKKWAPGASIVGAIFSAAMAAAGLGTAPVTSPAAALVTEVYQELGLVDKSIDASSSSVAVR